jgi:hypothetical protein
MLCSSFRAGMAINSIMLKLQKNGAIVRFSIGGIPEFP